MREAESWAKTVLAFLPWASAMDDAPSWLLGLDHDLDNRFDAASRRFLAGQIRGSTASSRRGLLRR